MGGRGPGVAQEEGTKLNHIHVQYCIIRVHVCTHTLIYVHVCTCIHIVHVHACTCHSKKVHVHVQSTVRLQKPN